MRPQQKSSLESSHKDKMQQDELYNEQDQFSSPNQADSNQNPTSKYQKMEIMKDLIPLIPSLVDSRTEVVNQQNVQNRANDRNAQRHQGIVIRIKELLKKEGAKIPDQILIEIRNEGGAGRGPVSTRQTKLVPKSSPVWDEDFYYNNNLVLDDNITFILRDAKNTEYARVEVQNLSIRPSDDKDKEVSKQSSNVDIRKVTYEMCHDRTVIADLLVEISYYQREDILGGVLMPNLSLKPPPGFVHKYNAVDAYSTQFVNKPGSRANCFNFYDGGLLPGFDNLEVFPSKIKRRNILNQQPKP